MSDPALPDDTPSRTPARRTPYELVFYSDDFEARIFPRIRAEAEERGVDPLLPDRFGFLTVAADAVRSVIAPEAPAEAFDQYRALLYQAFNFWRLGKRVYVLDPAVARYLVEAAPAMHGWELSLPHPSMYVELPANLFWSSISPDSTPEPVDGFFVTAAESEDSFGRPFRRLEVLLVLGIRRDRAGFSVIPFDTEVGPGIVQVWTEAPGREQGQGRDFESTLPGGDLAQIYSVLTTTEMLKLLARTLWYIDSYPEDVALERAPERRADPKGGAPPSRLPYHRVSFGVHGLGAGDE